MQAIIVALCMAVMLGACIALRPRSDALSRTASTALVPVLVLALAFANPGLGSGPQDHHCQSTLGLMEQLSQRVGETEQFAKDHGLKDPAATKLLAEARQYLYQARVTAQRGTTGSCLIAASVARVGHTSAAKARALYRRERLAKDGAVNRDAAGSSPQDRRRTCTVTVMRQHCRRLITIPPYYTSPSQICWWEGQETEGQWNPDKKCCEVEVDGWKECVEEGGLVWGMPIYW